MESDAQPERLPRTRSGLKVVAVGLLGLILLLALYAASIGPIVGMGLENNQYARALYRPIDWLIDGKTPVATPLKWYLKLWDCRPRPPLPNP